MIKAIAIDDEYYALKVLEEHFSKISFMQLKTFINPLEGIEFLKNEQISALFLDIHMQDINGIDIAELVSSEIKIVFTTAYPQYAVKGFEISAFDYLVKPISFTRILKTCHKLKNSLDANQNEQPLLLRDGNEIHRIKVDDIYYIEANGNYIKLHTSKKPILLRQTVKGFIETLNPNIFLRIHKSYIVNLQHISRIEPFQITIDTQPLPLSPNYKKEVFLKLGIV